MTCVERGCRRRLRARRSRPAGLQTKQGYQVRHGLADFAVHDRRGRTRSAAASSARAVSSRRVALLGGLGAPTDQPADQLLPGRRGQEDERRASGQLRRTWRAPCRSISSSACAALGERGEHRRRAACRSGAGRARPPTPAARPSAISRSNSASVDEQVVHAVDLAGSRRSGGRRDRDEDLRMLAPRAAATTVPLPTAVGPETTVRRGRGQRRRRHAGAHSDAVGELGDQRGDLVLARARAAGGWRRCRAAPSPARPAPRRPAAAPSARRSPWHVRDHVVGLGQSSSTSARLSSPGRGARASPSARRRRASVAASRACCRCSSLSGGIVTARSFDLRSRIGATCPTTGGCEPTPPASDGSHLRPASASAADAIVQRRVRARPPSTSRLSDGSTQVAARRRTPSARSAAPATLGADARAPGSSR